MCEIWCRIDPSLVQVQWAGERILYHPASGETHFLNAVGAQILDRLTEAPASAAVLVQCLADTGQAAESPSALYDQISSILARLDELGIVVVQMEPSSRE